MSRSNESATVSPVAMTPVDIDKSDRNGKKYVTEAGKLLLGVVACYTCVFALRFFSGSWWVADLFAHFPLQGFVSGIFLTICGIAIRHRKTTTIVALMTACYAFELAPYLPDSSPENNGGTSSRSLLAWNVFVGNTERKQVIETIRLSNADYVLLTEIDDGWKSEFRSLKDIYPVQVVSDAGAFGIAFLSREPVNNLRVSDIGEGRELKNCVLADLAGGVALWGVHCYPPRGASYSQARNRQIEVLQEAISRTQGPSILAGDLNLSPWSSHFSRLTTSTGLVDTRKGRGLLNSWPASTLIVRTAIDHILVTPQIEISSFERIDSSCGSDHFGLLLRYFVEN